MAKFGPLVADRQTEKKDNAMVKSTKQHNQKATPKRIAVIKNGMTAAEMKISGDHWVNHKGAYLTMAEVMAIEADKQTKK